MKRVKLSEDVRVELGDARSYPIVFSPVASLAAALEDFGFSSKGKCVLVSNDLVGKTKHKQVALESLKNAGWNVSYVEFPDGEDNKTRKCTRGRCCELKGSEGTKDIQGSSLFDDLMVSSFSLCKTNYFGFKSRFQRRPIWMW